MTETIKLPLGEVLDLIDSPVHEEHADNWRWGSSTYYVFEKDKKFYGVTLRYQPEHGMMDCNDKVVECVRVVSAKKIITIKEWIPYDE